MKILFLQKRFLFPADTGGKIRTLNVIRHLAKWHEVTYLCNQQEADEPYRSDMIDLGVELETILWHETPRYTLPFYRDLAINMFSQYPYNVNKDYDPRLRKRARDILANGNTDLVICDFVQMARNVIGLDTPGSVLFEHNVEAQIFKRHSQTDKGMLRRAYMWLQWKKMASFEAYAGHQFDRVIAVSEIDRQMYSDQYGWEHVDVIDTSVDVDYFSESDHDEVPDRMVFVGSMDWLPNIDAMKFFCDDVLPLIQRQRPQAHLQIVGRNPTTEIAKLGERLGVEVTGNVDDTRPYLSAASVVVVPLRIGGGTRLKIPEAMAMKKAIVSTTIGAEGLPVVDGQEIALSDTPKLFAQRTRDLLASEKSRAELAENGLALVHKRFSSESVARQFESYCQCVVDAKSSERRLNGE